MELVNLVSYKVHHMLVAWFMRESGRDPPMEYQRISLSQLTHAGEETFVRMASKTRDGLAQSGRRTLCKGISRGRPAPSTSANHGKDDTGQRK